MMNKKSIEKKLWRLAEDTIEISNEIMDNTDSDKNNYLELLREISIIDNMNDVVKHVGYSLDILRNTDEELEKSCTEVGSTPEKIVMSYVMSEMKGNSQ